MSWGLSALAILALAACTPSTDNDEAASKPSAHPVTAVSPPYAAALTNPLEAWPQMAITGLLRIADGCAMMGDDLLVFEASTRGVLKSDGRPAVLLGGDPDRQVIDGDGLMGDGGRYSLDSATHLFGGVREPVSERCLAPARGMLLMSVTRSAPPSRFAKRLYVPMQRRAVVPNLAPITGTIGVVDQCLMLDDRLLVLPIGSTAAFDDDGTLDLGVADVRYQRTLAARPGDRVEGSGSVRPSAGDDLAQSLLQPIPARPADRLPGTRPENPAW